MSEPDQSTSVASGPHHLIVDGAKVSATRALGKRLFAEIARRPQTPYTQADLARTLSDQELLHEAVTLPYLYASASVCAYLVKVATDGIERTALLYGVTHAGASEQGESDV